MTDDAILITGWGAICAAGDDPEAIADSVRQGRSAVGPIRRWDTTAAPTRVGGEIRDLDPLHLIPDRKVHKLLRRTDVLGLYAAARAIECAGLERARADMDAATAMQFNERTAVFVAGEGGSYEDQYDFFPTLTASAGDAHRFGAELTATVTPMWLLQTLPNNVLCHVGIRHGFKGPNTCITNHSVGGALALIEAAGALRAGEADRAVVVAHAARVEPQSVLYYATVGLLAVDALRPFDLERSGSVLGEGAGALVLETARAARKRGAAAYGYWLGSGYANDAQGMLAIDPDGESLARAMSLALEEGGRSAADVGFVVAHGNGTVQSDESEARAICAVLGPTPPPVTAFKWAFGHTLTASSILDTMLALAALRDNTVPGIATLRTVDPACALPVCAAAQAPRGDTALVLSRGFGGQNVALLLQGAPHGQGAFQ